jgi:hypothetical protein
VSQGTDAFVAYLVVRQVERRQAFINVEGLCEFMHTNVRDAVLHEEKLSDTAFLEAICKLISSIIANVFKV